MELMELMRVWRDEQAAFCWCHDIKLNIKKLKEIQWGGFLSAVTSCCLEQFTSASPPSLQFNLIFSGSSCGPSLVLICGVLDRQLVCVSSSHTSSHSSYHRWLSRAARSLFSRRLISYSQFLHFSWWHLLLCPPPSRPPRLICRRVAPRAAVGPLLDTNRAEEEENSEEEAKMEYDREKEKTDSKWDREREKTYFGSID